MSRRRRSGRTTLSISSLLLLLALAALVWILRQPDVFTPRRAAVPSEPVAGDWYEVRFTRPLIPDDRSRHRGGPDEALVALMDKATKTLDVASYDFDLANVAAAMARAKGRGVAVRMVTDTDTLENKGNEPVQAAFARLRQAGVPVVGDERAAIMHHKFTVVDGEWVQTGSWNYTDGDTYRLNNNMVILHSPKLAANYSAEFERMFSRRQFGPQKREGAAEPVLEIGGVRVENYFAPKDGVASRLVATIREARESVYFLAFSFTHDGIGQAIIDKAAAGVRVAGVFETTGSSTRFSEYGRMKDAGLEVYQDGSPYAMHHKVVIIDERAVVFGSFNFSEGADESNDENVLIVHDPALAQAFKAEFDRVLSLAKNRPQ